MESGVNNGIKVIPATDWYPENCFKNCVLIDQVILNNGIQATQIRLGMDANVARTLVIDQVMPATDWYPENCFKNCVLIDQVMHDSYTRHWLIPWELFQELRFDWPSYARQLYPPLIDTLRTVSRTAFWLTKLCTTVIHTLSNIMWSIWYLNVKDDINESVYCLRFSLIVLAWLLLISMYKDKPNRFLNLLSQHYLKVRPIKTFISRINLGDVFRGTLLLTPVGRKNKKKALQETMS